jgi:hypothetical protein
MVKILMLILASDTNDEYLAFQNEWLKYMNLAPANIDCYFYKGDPHSSEKVKINYFTNTITVSIEDTYANIYEKTLRVFEYFYPILSSYDFIFRTNLSSFIRFDKYIQLAKTFPKENFCSAIIGGDNKIKFPSGAGFTITPDIVKRLCDERPPYIVMDDVSIGYALQNWKISIYQSYRYDIKENDQIETFQTDHFHFRLKTNNRSQDVINYKKLVNK